MKKAFYIGHEPAVQTWGDHAWGDDDGLIKPGDPVELPDAADVSGLFTTDRKEAKAAADAWAKAQKDLGTDEPAAATDVEEDDHQETGEVSDDAQEGSAS